MGQWKESRAVTKQAWGVLKDRPYMVLFPLLGAILAVIAVGIPLGAGLGILGWSRVSQAATDQSVTTSEAIIGIIVLAIAAYLGVLVTQLFMGGLVAAADEELQGRKSSLGSGMSKALSRFPAIAGWAGIETAVGWLLSAVRDNNSSNGIVRLLGALFSFLLSVTWAVITFFVLPLIVLRDMSPVTAIKHSISTVRSTWGTRVAGGVRIGAMIGLFAVLPAVIAAVIGVLLSANDNAIVGVPIITVALIVLIVASLVINTLKVIYSVALLHWTEDRSAIGPFSDADLAAAVRSSGGQSTAAAS